MDSATSHAIHLFELAEKSRRTAVRKQDELLKWLAVHDVDTTEYVLNTDQIRERIDADAPDEELERLTSVLTSAVRAGRLVRAQGT